MQPDEAATEIGMRYEKARISYQPKSSNRPLLNCKLACAARPEIHKTGYDQIPPEQTNAAEEMIVVDMEVDIAQDERWPSSNRKHLYPSTTYRPRIANESKARRLRLCLGLL